MLIVVFTFDILNSLIESNFITGSAIMRHIARTLLICISAILCNSPSNSDALFFSLASWLNFCYGVALYTKAGRTIRLESDNDLVLIKRHFVWLATVLDFLELSALKCMVLNCCYSPTDSNTFPMSLGFFSNCNDFILFLLVESDTNVFPSFPWLEHDNGRLTWIYAHECFQISIRRWSAPDLSLHKIFHVSQRFSKYWSSNGIQFLSSRQGKTCIAG
mmetsp:Transcript_107068/g.169223  ORF Transcript_107068/g.169223 Transcript_107068/m.169223 type:complete len:218 (+) Transcript_107068:1807-2460(+)